MTPVQIQQLFPGAQPPGIQGSLYGGAKELLAVPDVEIAGNTFVASFFFKDNGLTQVMLKLTGEETTDGMERAYVSLYGAFRAKYCDEELTTMNTAFMRTMTTEWLPEGRRVILRYFECRDCISDLSIVYQVRLPSREELNNH
ncbi:hypothetical protein SAMN05216210_2114 [Halopseudomonas salegens]|uniref:Uncharacterized protein n=2 Tax=Halopseudomonas salegens TaxID=1434072 RepID=A0A1H2G886_9GAMM|nr:hypothetical protein SAMN05216210_2114 [Halopseudomonas salegens]